MFPGFENQLIANGAADLDAGRDVAWLSRMGWGPNFVSNLAGISGDDAYVEATDRPVSSPHGHSGLAQSPPRFRRSVSVPFSQVQPAGPSANP